MRTQEDLLEEINSRTGIIIPMAAMSAIWKSGVTDIETFVEKSDIYYLKLRGVTKSALKIINAAKDALAQPKPDLTQQLADAINKMLDAANAIAEVTNLAMSDPDIRFIDHFKDTYKAPLIRSADEIETILSPTADSIRTLALVLYVKDMEAISPVGNWRALVATRPVEAIRILRNDIDKLDLREAKMVVDAYKKNPF